MTSLFWIMRSLFPLEITVNSQAARLGELGPSVISFFNHWNEAWHAGVAIAVTMAYRNVKHFCSSGMLSKNR
jgi:hypothetical protein